MRHALFVTSSRSEPARGPWHTKTPAVYLDQWVWVRLAKAAVGRPELPSDTDVLSAVREAAESGVAFPLSSTHYFETQAVKDPRRRRDLTNVMAPISGFLALRSRRDLVQHQLRTVMHEQWGRPAFRPAPIKVLGRGAAWAMTGKQLGLDVQGPEALATESMKVLGPSFIRHALQYTEYTLLAGPADNEVDQLRDLGYRPEKTAASAQSRLDWEKDLVEKLAAEPVSATELRVYLSARELLHEYLDPFTELLAEYRLSVPRVLGLDPDKAKVGRKAMLRFSDAVPTLRIAVDTKFGLFRDESRVWSLNHMYDVDAVAVAAPYCRVVVADKDLVHRAVTSLALNGLGTVITSRLGELVDRLDPLRAEASLLGSDPAGWDEVGPGSGFNTALPRLA